ncbi:MAG: GNAT family N-acetyltransferase [endosymbiont of Escarpia spicata]|uniref:GNAT family N-acetyltransferase n=1 Tax=endosymbiont of Escarpia spicata TaxID=2200908 RepID=A0A370DCR0_9GAMM|nr:MAG: GNAT family N-acetyltransferase [endosymbiont of Escarpia spicata]
MAFFQEFVLADQSQHDIKAFDCGKPDMDRFLARFAVKNMRLGLSRTWVLPVVSERQQAQKAQIAAYYSLAASTVVREEIPTNIKLPGYPVPVVLLARLAVEEQFKGQRLGEKTLITALRKSVELTDAGLPALNVILDVLDEDALGFYQRYEMFEPFTDDPMRLFVPMHTLRHIR